MRFKQSLLSLLSLASLLVRADLVHVVEQTEVGGVTNVVRDTTKLTGMPWATAAAPTVAGQIFTHWTISTKQEFSPRDAWGRAYDAPIFMLYEDTTLTAHYLAESQDTDGDGVPDGYEMYWYGDLSKNGDSDTDGDGFTFAQEIANGTNPLVGDEDVDGPIVYDDGALRLYNPSNFVSVTIRSEPEGAVVSTSEEWLRPGTYVTTASLSPNTSNFAYWMRNGEIVRDAWGRAVDRISFTMSTNAEEIVAVVAEDYETRMKLYWYGDATVAMDSDTDGDGFTFAQELANGTNPLVGDEDVDGPVSYTDGALLQYNPHNYQPYLMRSEPEGALFATISNYVTSGLVVSIGSQDLYANGLAYWTLNGVEQRDAWGRALDNLNLQMPTNALTLVAHVVSNATDRAKLYWYGTTDVSLESDTDGDGFTFAQELANGTNPHVGDDAVDGPITFADTELHETNLQIYEQAVGALVNGKYIELFTSPIVSNNATSVTFGGQGGNDGRPCSPVVVDLNADGLFDIVVLYQGGYRTFINVGGKGNPEFEERYDVSTNGFDLAMNDTRKLADMTFDASPINALSATTNGNTLLVSDAEGRIWYYLSTPTPNTYTYSLQHKVWGGSYAGFAQGLMLAAVDWDDDGDLDCLCGTAEGKLMLLRDPKVGRPTNLKADAGADNVLLTWDPNEQSRVRGYKVYRAVGASSDYGVRGAPALPSYRDEGLAAGTYGYKVSALSRFYTAGNSTLTETESVATEPVTATVGGPIITIGDPVKMPDGTVQIVVSINNSMNYQAAGTSIAVPYDAANLAYQKTLPSGISEKLVYKTTAADDVATIAITTGEVAPGSGTFFTLVFHGLSDGVLMGDLDGDGQLTDADLRLLAKLKSAAGRKYTDYQLKAGDFNHNGKLDNADYQALRSILKGENQL